MKIVEAPPKTGEEFIVAWFDDGKADSWCCKYNNEHGMFERFWIDENCWVSITDGAMRSIVNSSLIIIEG